MQNTREPIRAIVGRFSERFSFQMIEEMLREYPFEHCAIIASGLEPRYFQAIPSACQRWFVSSQVRGSEYPGVLWEELLPLDEELIESMRECEATFMEMVTRLEWKKRVSYDIRKQWYFRHLRFWNDYITRNRINFYLSAWIPHEIPDIVIYYLCKLKQIPVVYFGISSVRDASFIEHDWQESNIQTGKRYAELLARTPDTTDPLTIPLHERFDQRYRALVRSSGEIPPLEQQEVDVPFTRSVHRAFLRHPFRVLHFVLLYLTPSGINRALNAWRRWRIRRQANAFYDAHAVQPDLHRPFVYMPLHFQPEATTVPQAGGYEDQLLVAQMLNARLPDDVLIYVKEHPRSSGMQKRNIQFYSEFLGLPKVRFMPRGFSTFVLREHCKATVTAAGTAGFEGLFRGKPTLLFGHCYYQYAPGVFRIHTSNDCREAVHAVFTEGRSPTRLQCRLFLKAMEETCVHGVTDPFCFNVSRLTEQQNAAACSRAIMDEIRAQFGQVS
ncbi:MAG: hypothetical protein Q7S29_03655 [Candidatus Peribacter sp.]|nr:hypothetical protein [Candidatus Peribacter sp.]